MEKERTSKILASRKIEYYHSRRSLSTTHSGKRNFSNISHRENFKAAGKSHLKNQFVK